MLEILALVYFSRQIGDLAVRKGLKRGWWRFYTVIAWFGAEIFGIIISMLIFPTDEALALLPLGYACAIASYFILKTSLSKRPDVETAFEFENQNQQR